MKDDEIRQVPKPRQESYARLAERGDRNRVPRAKRYEINAVAKYRIQGERDWHEGVMKNMSTTGILIGTGSSLPLESMIEMRFFLPVQLTGGESAGEVHCRGSVVRSWDCPLPAEVGAMVAARINHSRFLRRER